MEIRRRYRPRKRELRELAVIASGWGIRIEKPEEVEVVELEDGRAVLVRGMPALFWCGDKPCPTLHALLGGATLPRVTVDMGAVPHIASGADVMGPGVTGADPGIREGDPVAIVDEKHAKAIAVGIALTNSEGMRVPRGKVVKNVHHVGDDIWKLGK